MITVPLRGVLISLIALVAIGGVVAGAKGPAATDTPGESENANFTSGACVSSGTTIVVDFGASQTKPAIVRCVSNFHGTGWELFEAAGLEVEGTSEYPKAFVCRIDGVPSSITEDCKGTPTPITGTWSYFYATDRGQSKVSAKNEWIRSPVGAATRKPNCGDFEGWLFSKAEFQEEKTKQPVTPSPSPSPFSCK